MKNMKLGFACTQGGEKCDLKIVIKDGVYNISYKPVVVGTYQFNVKVEDDQHDGLFAIPGCQFVVQIGPEGAVPENCEVKQLLKEVEPNKKTKIATIVAKDKDSKQRPKGSKDDFLVVITDKDGGHPKKAELVNNDDGTYDVFFTQDKPGTMLAHTKLNAQNLPKESQTPLVFECNRKMKVKIDGIPKDKPVSSYAKQSAKIHLLDDNDKPLQYNPEVKIVAKVVDKNGKELVLEQKDNKDSTFDVVIEPTKENIGECEIFVEVDDKKNDPSALKFLVSPVVMSKSFLKGPGIKNGIIAGKTTWVKVGVADNEDNLIYDENFKPVLVITHEGKPVDYKSENNKDGTITYTFIAPLGEIKIEATDSKDEKTKEHVKFPSYCNLSKTRC